jgi:hypothetical protein
MQRIAWKGKEGKKKAQGTNAHARRTAREIEHRKTEDDRNTHVHRIMW